MLAHTDTSQAKGREFLGRRDRDAPTSDVARDAQYDASVDWGVPDPSALQRLTGIESPTRVLQGDDDLMIPTKLRQERVDIGCDLGRVPEEKAVCRVGKDADPRVREQAGQG